MKAQNGGSNPENWISKTGRSHQFDCLKYAYFARDYALQSVPKTRYRFAKSPLILKRYEKQKKQIEQQQQESAKKGWFHI